MTGIDALGFLAAGLVLGTFCMKRLIPLRTLAITSNVAFVLYGYSAGIEPVLRAGRTARLTRADLSFCERGRPLPAGR